MEKKYSVAFIKLESLLPNEMSTIHSRLLDTQYSEQTGFGFTRVSGNVDYIYATLLKRTPTYISDIELGTWQFKRREIFLYNEYEFELDFKYSLLQIFGSSKNISKVLSSIIPLFNSDIKIKQLRLSPVNIAQNLLDSNNLIGVEKLTVNNFAYQNGISGRFDMSIENLSLGFDIIKEYNEDISKAVFKISTSTSDPFLFSVSRNGSIVLRCEEAFFTEYLSVIKSCLFC